MAKYGPASAFLLVGGRDISSDTFQLDEGLEQVITQSNGLGSTWEEHLPIGVARATLEASGGIYDDETDGIVDALQEQGSTRQLVSYGFAGDTIGQDAIHVDGDYAATWKRTAARDGLVMAHATHRLSGARLEGKILHGLDAETTAGDTESSSVDNTTSSTGGATADLHVPALTLGGYTNVIVKVRHSTDDISYSDLITFTAVTTVSSERKTVAGTVNRYLAMSWAWTGSGSGQSVIPYVVLNRGE